MTDKRDDTPDREAEAGGRFARREAFAGDVHAETGIDEDMIQRLVHAFYARVREDALLGPVFALRITDWPLHLERMCAFWSSVMLMSGRYHGRPLPAHATLPVEPGHFARWLALFKETAHEVTPPAAALRFVARAETIAENIARAVAVHRGELPQPALTSIGRRP